MWSVLGWIVWGVVAFLAVTFACGCRRNTAAGQGFAWASGVMTLFWWLIAIVFLVTPLNKLHIIWLIPLGFFGASFIAITGVPVLSPLILFFTRV
ncbi:MAG: hypothetical protein WC713_06365, partial [Candidatus Methylomirabilota bacterium]